MTDMVFNKNARLVLAAIGDIHVEVASGDFAARVAAGFERANNRDCNPHREDERNGKGNTDSAEL